MTHPITIELPEYHKPMYELRELWRQLGGVPTAGEDDNLLDEPFLHFPRGTDLLEVWHWFEHQNPEFSVAEAMGMTR